MKLTEAGRDLLPSDYYWALEETWERNQSLKSALSVIDRPLQSIRPRFAAESESMLQHMAHQLQNLPGKVWQILLGIAPVPLCTCDLGQRWGKAGMVWDGKGMLQILEREKLDPSR